MKQKIIFWFLATTLALAGCFPIYPTHRAATKNFFLSTPLSPTALPSVVRTLVPPTVTELPPVSSAYPVPSEETPTQRGYPYPAAQSVSGSTPAASSTQPAAVSFLDCARTPGLVACADQNVALKAYLAFYDASAGRVIGLDLENGQGWQSLLPAGQPPTWLSWSMGGANGSQLMVSLGNNQYDVFSAAGNLLETFSSETPPAWQPGGALSRDGTLRSETGAEARLVQTRDMQWLLHIRTAQGEQRSLPVEANPADLLYTLRSWAPGGKMLLAQSYFASNQAMTQGGQLILIDAETGAIQSIKASMAINDQAAAGYAWDPVQSELLAFLETSETSVLAPRLAMLDIKTGQLHFPLPEGLQVNGLAWHPDGRLAFAVGQINAMTPPDAKKDFPSSGIYLLDPQSGKITNLVAAPQGAIDTWPQWADGGQTLVYARALPGSNDALLVQVRARRVSDGMEWVLVDSLPATEQAMEPGFAKRLLAFTQK
jgi:hypothetical protein